MGIFNGNDDVQLYIDGTDSGGTTTTSNASATDSAGFGAHIGVAFSAQIKSCKWICGSN